MTRCVFGTVRKVCHGNRRKNISTVKTRSLFGPDDRFDFCFCLFFREKRRNKGAADLSQNWFSIPCCNSPYRLILIGNPGENSKHVTVFNSCFHFFELHNTSIFIFTELVLNYNNTFPLIWSRTLAFNQVFPIHVTICNCYLLNS